MQVNNDKKLQGSINTETEVEIKQFWEQNIDMLGRNKILEMFCPQVNLSVLVSLCVPVCVCVFVRFLLSVCAVFLCLCFCLFSILCIYLLFVNVCASAVCLCFYVVCLWLYL